jgi:DNA (cytosine-5)-methyltransferase 1
LAKKNSKLMRPIFERSGWPVILAPFASEARRRFEKGDLTSEEYYCSDILMAGYKRTKGD